MYQRHRQVRSGRGGKGGKWSNLHVKNLAKWGLIGVSFPQGLGFKSSLCHLLTLSLSFLIYKMGIHLTGWWPKWAEREMGFEWEALTGSGSQALIKVGAPCR